MAHFHRGFQDELIKIALRPRTKAWAIARALTSGVAGGLMAGLTLHMAQRGRPKKERTSPIKAAIPSALLSTGLGLGKGIFEKGIERKVLGVLTRGKVR